MAEVFDIRKAQEADVEKHYILTEEEKKNSKFGKLVFPLDNHRNSRDHDAIDEI